MMIALKVIHIKFQMNSTKKPTHFPHTLPIATLVARNGGSWVHSFGHMLAVLN